MFCEALISELKKFLEDENTSEKSITYILQSYDHATCRITSKCLTNNFTVELNDSIQESDLGNDLVDENGFDQDDHDTDKLRESFFEFSEQIRKSTKLMESNPQADINGGEEE